MVGTIATVSGSVSHIRIQKRSMKCMTKTWVGGALALAISVVFAGCARSAKSSDASPATAAFAAIPLDGSSVNGAFSYYLGVLVVGRTTGTISVCFKTCQVIGKTEPPVRRIRSSREAAISPSL
jgi:hypothetical protein